MGKHDDYAHFMHITKQMKFRPPKPANSYLRQSSTAPQAPSRKSTNYNRYLGHGKGV